MDICLIYSHSISCQSLKRTLYRGAENVHATTKNMVHSLPIKIIYLCEYSSGNSE